MKRVASLPQNEYILYADGNRFIVAADVLCYKLYEVSEDLTLREVRRFRISPSDAHPRALIGSDRVIFCNTKNVTTAKLLDLRDSSVISLSVSRQVVAGDQSKPVITLLDYNHAYPFLLIGDSLCQTEAALIGTICHGGLASGTNTSEYDDLRRDLRIADNPIDDCICCTYNGRLISKGIQWIFDGKTTICGWFDCEKRIKTTGRPCIFRDGFIYWDGIASKMIYEEKEKRVVLSDEQLEIFATGANWILTRNDNWEVALFSLD